MLFGLVGRLQTLNEQYNGSSRSSISSDNIRMRQNLDGMTFNTAQNPMLVAFIIHINYPRTKPNWALECNKWNVISSHDNGL